MKRVLKALLGLLLLGWIVTFVGSFALALRLRREAPPPPDPSADEVELVAVLDQLNFRSEATRFAGGRMDCVFAGSVVDLRDATLSDSGARFDARCIFGGAQLIVPDEWRVTWTSRGIFGGIGDGRRSRERPDDAPHLDIDALALFGGIGISSASD